MTVSTAFFSIKLLLLLFLPSLTIFYTYFISDYDQLNSSVPWFLMAQVLVYFLGRFKNWDVFDPFHGVSVLYFLYSSAALMYVSETRQIPQGDAVDLNHALQFCSISIILQSIISITNLFSSQRILSASLPAVLNVRIISKRSIQLASIVIVLLIALQVSELNPMNIASYGDRVLEYNLTKRLNATSGLNDFINIFLQMCIFFLSIFLLTSRNASIFFRCVSWFSIFIILLKYFLAGDRANLVTCILSLIIVWHYFVSRLRPRFVITFAVIGYILFNLISVARISSDPLVMIAAVTEFVIDNGVAMFALDRSGELMAGSNFIKLIKEVDAYGVRLGGNILDSILAFIPRFVIEREGYFGNETFVRWYYPEVFSDGGGHGYFLPMDGYRDFGIIGAVVFMALYVILLKVAYYFLLKNKGDIIYVFFYSLFYAQAIAFGMRSGIFAATKQFLLYAASLLIVYVVTRLTPRRS